jgi:hypothetical protein
MQDACKSDTSQSETTEPPSHLSPTLRLLPSPPFAIYANKALECLNF